MITDKTTTRVEPRPTSHPAAARRRLSRDADGRPAAPVRIVHLGVGNFFRAHAAWYTEHASDADRVGDRGLHRSLAGHRREPGRSRTASTRCSSAGRTARVPEVISSLSAVHASDDLDALRGYFADPAVAVVTITVTEAGYRRDGPVAWTSSADDVARRHRRAASGSAGRRRHDDPGQARRGAVGPTCSRCRPHRHRAQRQRARQRRHGRPRRRRPRRARRRHPARVDRRATSPS